MYSLLLSFIVFTGAVCVHIVIHRVLARWGIVTLKTIIVYGLGLVVLVPIARPLPLPLTAITLYSALVAAYLLFFLSVYFEGESPSAKLLAILKANKPLAYRQILAQFTNSELFATRLRRLVDGGFLSYRARAFRATQKGLLLARAFEFYRSILGWDEGG